MEHSGDKKETAEEILASKYPHAFTAEHLEKFIGRGTQEFTAYIPGSGPQRGVVKILRKDGGFRITWSGNNFALLPEGEKNPVYLDNETVAKLGLDPQSALNAIKPRSRSEIIQGDPVLELVKAHSSYEEMVKNRSASVNEITAAKERYDKAREVVYPEEERLRKIRLGIRQQTERPVPAGRESSIEIKDDFGVASKKESA